MSSVKLVVGKRHNMSSVKLAVWKGHNNVFSAVSCRERTYFYFFNVFSEVSCMKWTY